MFIRAEQGNKTGEQATKERPYWDHNKSEITKVSKKKKQKHKTRVQSIVGGLCEYSQAINMQNLKIKEYGQAKQSLVKIQRPNGKLVLCKPWEMRDVVLGFPT